MKRKLIFIMAVTLLLIGAKAVRTVRLTVINKSGLPVEIRLTGKYYEEVYYMRIESGDRTTPFDAHIDVVPDTYSMQIFYKEYWDPVYGYDCNEGGKSVVLSNNTRLTFLGCNYQTPTADEAPSILKYPTGRNRCRAPRLMPPEAVSVLCK